MALELLLSDIRLYLTQSGNAVMDYHPNLFRQASN
jgi:hypothetical protein